MLKVTYLKLNGEEKTTDVPVSWRDIKWSKYVDASCQTFNNEIEKLAAFCGIETEVLLMNPLLLKACIESCAFIWDNSIDKYINIVPAKYKVDIDKADWGKLETVKVLINNAGAYPFKAGKEVVKIYCDIDIDNLPCTEAIGVVGFFLRK